MNRQQWALMLEAWLEPVRWLPIWLFLAAVSLQLPAEWANLVSSAAGAWLREHGANLRGGALLLLTGAGLWMALNRPKVNWAVRIRPVLRAMLWISTLLGLGTRYLAERSLWWVVLWALVTVLLCFLDRWIDLMVPWQTNRVQMADASIEATIGRLRTLIFCALVGPFLTGIWLRIPWLDPARLPGFLLRLVTGYGWWSAFLDVILVLLCVVATGSALTQRNRTARDPDRPQVWAYLLLRILPQLALIGVYFCFLGLPSWLATDSQRLRVAWGAGVVLIVWASWATPYYDPHSHRDDNPKFYGDKPVDQEDGDKLSRRGLARTLLYAAAGAPGNETFVIGLFGGWGTGKTSVMRMAESFARESHHMVVWLNCWLYDDPDQIVQAFLKGLKDAFRTHGLYIGRWSDFSLFHRLAASLAKGPSAVSIPSLGLSALFQPLPTEKQLQRAREQVDLLVDRVVSPSHGTNRKLIIFLDDLDRCTPESIFSTLEFIKQVASFRRCVIILGADRESVVQALQTRYGDRAWDFLHKVVNAAIDLDDIPAEQLEPVFAEHTQLTLWMSPEEASRTVRFMAEVLRGNPRQFKYLLNSITMLRELQAHRLRTEMPVQVLIHWELLRLVSPRSYSRIKEKTLFAALEKTYAELFPRAGAPGPDAALVWLDQIARAIALKDPLPRGELEKVGDVLRSLLDHLGEQGSAGMWGLFQYQNEMRLGDYSRLVEVLTSFEGSRSLDLSHLSDAEVRTLVFDAITWKNYHLKRRQHGTSTEGGITSNKFCRKLVRKLLEDAGHVGRLQGLAELVRHEREFARDAYSQAYLEHFVKMAHAWDPSEYYVLHFDRRPLAEHELTAHRSRLVSVLRERWHWEKPGLDGPDTPSSAIRLFLTRDLRAAAKDPRVQDLLRIETPFSFELGQLWHRWLSQPDKEAVEIWFDVESDLIWGHGRRLEASILMISESLRRRAAQAPSDDPKEEPPADE